jgi:hypothetical protein
MIENNKYLNEAISRFELMFGVLWPHTSHLETGDHPEMDESILLRDDGVPEFYWYADVDADVNSHNWEN